MAYVYRYTDLKDNIIIAKIDWNGKEMYSINQILIDKNRKKSIYHIGKVACEVSDSKYYDNLFNSEGFASRLYGTRECY